MLGSFLSYPLLLIWLFLTVKVKLRVAVSVSYTEITISQNKVLAHSKLIHLKIILNTENIV